MELYVGISLLVHLRPNQDDTSVSELEVFNRVVMSLEFNSGNVSGGN